MTEAPGITREPRPWAGTWVRYGRRQRGGLLALVVLAALEAGVSVARPWPLQIVIDHVLGGRPVVSALARLLQVLPGGTAPDALLWWSLGAMLGVVVTGWAIRLARGLVETGIGQRVSYEVAADLFDHLQRRSLLFHAHSPVGDAIRRVTTDAGYAAVLVRDVLAPGVLAACSLAAMFAVMWRLDAILTVCALAIVPPLALAVRWYAGPLLTVSTAHHAADARTYDVVEDALSAVGTVQAFGQEAREEARFAASSDAVLGTTIRMTDVQLQLRILLGVSGAVGTAAVLYLGARHTLDGRLSLGTTLVFMSYLGSLYAPLEALMYTSSAVQDAAASARRVAEVLAADPVVADPVVADPAVPEPPRSPAPVGTGRGAGRSAGRGALAFDAVTAGYAPGRPVLAGLALALAPGELVAVVGASGAGKSTLAALVPRFLDPWTGAVRLDGRDLRSLPLAALRAQVAVVPQAPTLFARSVAENIGYGRPGATRAEVEAAARAAHADGFIARLPAGYDTVLGAGGATLSGGERQRLAIARALLVDAPVLVLDEPTSALDPASERLLFGALARLAAGRTTLLIAHRRATVERADRVVVLADGRVVEAGPPAALLARGGAYAQLLAGAGEDGVLDRRPT